LIILLAATGLFAGCENFLDEEPKSNITTKNFYKTETDAVAATNAIYDYLTVGTDRLFANSFGGVFFNDFWVVPELMSDNARSTMSNVDFQHLSNFNLEATNQSVLRLWQDYYTTINACNTVLARVPDIDMDQQRKEQLLAEARFFRGMLYFDMMRWWGKVPFITEPTTDLSGYYQQREEKPVIYEQVIEDLNWAREHFMEGYRDGLGRPAPMTSEALLARVYLTRGMENNDPQDLQSAVDKADKVINQGDYSLWPDYKDIFKLENAHDGEIILGINFSASLSEGFKANQMLVRLLPSGLERNNEGPRNGKGWERPTETLYNAFDENDRRREVSFISSFTYSDGVTETFEPHFSKYWDREAEPRGHPSNADFIYMRLAEMYLIKAEALNEIHQGPTNEAYQAINTIRQRARYDGSLEQGILPDLSGLNYQEFREAVLLERQREFAIEGHRWFDLKRFGVLEEKVEASSKENATPAQTHYLLPIPQREIELNNSLEQNPGY